MVERRTEGVAIGAQDITLAQMDLLLLTNDAAVKRVLLLVA